MWRAFTELGRLSAQVDEDALWTSLGVWVHEQYQEELSSGEDPGLQTTGNSQGPYLTPKARTYPSSTSIGRGHPRHCVGLLCSFWSLSPLRTEPQSPIPHRVISAEGRLHLWAPGWAQVVTIPKVLKGVLISSLAPCPVPQGGVVQSCRPELLDRDTASRA
jgi:hypothetical protein